MSNAQKILAFLENAGTHCDDCISRKTSITPRQQVNAICRGLDGRTVHRGQARCAGCGSHKIVNHLVNHRAAPHRPAPPVAVKKPLDVHAAQHRPALAPMSDERIAVRFSSSNKSHSSVWGKQVHKLTDIPSCDVRLAFECIVRACDVTQIVLGPFGHGDKRKRVSVKLFESKEDFIEGRVFVLHAEKGTYQDFRVYVPYLDRISDIRKRLAQALCAKEQWAGKPTAS